MKFLPSAAAIDDSSMSFGEHLDELRSALWKAVISVALGFLVGLVVGDDLIRYVKAPLSAALEKLERDQKGRVYEAEKDEDFPSDDRFMEEGLAPEPQTFDSKMLVESLRSLGVAIEPPEDMPESITLWLWAKPQEAQPMATGVPNAFGVYVKASLVAGFVISSPAVFYFLWSFVAAGLYPHEKRYVHFFLPVSLGLFLLGAVVAFYFVLHYVISFLFGFNDWLGIEAMPRIDEWLSFVLILPVGFGISFQLPLVMLFLERIGVFSTETYTTYWKYAVLVIFIVSMLLSPPDPQSQILMAIPLTFLYFGGIALCKILPKGSGTRAERAAAAKGA